MDEAASLCHHCEARPPVKGAVNAWGSLPLLLLTSPFWFVTYGWGSPPFPLGAYCQPCGDRINFLGLLAWAMLVLGAVAFLIIRSA